MLCVCVHLEADSLLAFHDYDPTLPPPAMFGSQPFRNPHRLPVFTTKFSLMYDLFRSLCTAVSVFPKWKAVANVFCF